MTIVLAEDGTDHARIIMTVLKKQGYEVLWFTSGTDAYAYLSANPMPDLLITDVLMPGMSGFELLAKLKADEKMPRCFVLTSKQREQDILLGLELGAVDYITKPFSPSVMLAKVKNALAKAA